MPVSRGITAINLGCGTDVAPGWTNIDSSPNARAAKYPALRWLLWKMRLLSTEHYRISWPRDILIHDLRKPLPFASESVDYAYSSHTLEHLAREEGARLIREVWRVLKPGGIVRIVVPDLTLAVRRYLADLQQPMTCARAATTLLTALRLAPRGGRDIHRWMYDAPSLSALLEASGFSCVTVRGFREGAVPDCALLDNRPDDSLHIEATKPR
jgi:SAM-dependent methyltransferase